MNHVPHRNPAELRASRHRGAIHYSLVFFFTLFTILWCSSLHARKRFAHTLQNRSAKVADFGCSRRFGELKPNGHVTMCGTPMYVAPEVRLQGPIVVATAMDVYSFGYCLAEMIEADTSWTKKGYRHYSKPVVGFQILAPATINYVTNVMHI